MPHIVLEYSSNIKEKIDPSLFAEIHHILAQIGNAKLDTCQSRAIRCENFYIGEGDPKNAFVHLSILMAEGRALSIRQEIGKKVLESLRKAFPQSLKMLHLQITVYCREFSKSLYFKIPENSV